MTAAPDGDAFSAERLVAYMRAALDEAERGRFRVEPNPVVGALVVTPEGLVIGRGAHQKYGGPHAEIFALRDAGERARGATLVSTLEPCAHTRAKKTPRCVEAILNAGIARVVIGASDGDADTSGRAAAELREAGVEVIEDVLREECDELLAVYSAHVDAPVPWVIAKWAMSADGRIADASGGSRWITGETARELVHEIRGSVEAVIVGSGTALADDPALTCRLPLGKSALRVVLDGRLRLGDEAQLVQTAREIPTLVVTTDASPAERRSELESFGVEIAVVGAGDAGSPEPFAAARHLYDRGVRRALLEGGANVHGAWLRAGQVQQVMAFTAPVLLGGDGAPNPLAGAGWAIADAPRLERPRARPAGPDALLEGYVPPPPADA